jgi:hypothetical protein
MPRMSRHQRQKLPNQNKGASPGPTAVRTRGRHFGRRPYVGNTSRHIPPQRFKALDDSYVFKRLQDRVGLACPLLLRMSMSRCILKDILLLTFIVVISGGLYLSSLGENFKPRSSAASYDQSASTSSVAAVSNDSFHQQNPDSAAATAPLLERRSREICHFYDCR